MQLTSFFTWGRKVHWSKGRGREEGEKEEDREREREGEGEKSAFDFRDLITFHLFIFLNVF
jgi:hypothetical protein